MRAFPTYSYDLAKAKAEMAQSKYANGVDVDLVVGDFGQAVVNVSQAIVQQLAKIGIRAHLKVQTADANTRRGTVCGPARHSRAVHHPRCGVD